MLGYSRTTDPSWRTSPEVGAPVLPVAGGGDSASLVWAGGDGSKMPAPSEEATLVGPDSAETRETAASGAAGDAAGGRTGWNAARSRAVVASASGIPGAAGSIGRSCAGGVETKSVGTGSAVPPASGGTRTLAGRVPSATASGLATASVTASGLATASVAASVTASGSESVSTSGSALQAPGEGCGRVGPAGGRVVEASTLDVVSGESLAGEVCWLGAVHSSGPSPGSRGRFASDWVPQGRQSGISHQAKRGWVPGDGELKRGTLEDVAQRVHSPPTSNHANRRLLFLSLLSWALRSLTPCPTVCTTAFTVNT